MKDFSSGKPHVNDVERAPEDPYSPLLGQPEPASSNRRLTKTLLLVFVSMLLFSAFIAVVLNLPPRPGSNAHNGVRDKAADFKPVTSPGKVSRPVPDARLEWERTAFHFQPEKNFMSDPNGPLYYMGWYHLFYQYDPFKAIWGNMSWGHAVSKDMINWFHLPVAMVPDKWYDIEGVLTGSATILPNGDVIMLFTGNAYDFSQLQCLAYAVNKSDPLLIEWAKYEGNPILYPPEGIGLKDFRDPTSAWMGPDGKYRVAMGSRRGNRGLTLMYHTTDFIHYELLDEEVHGVNGTGMWECVDLYPVSTTNDYAYPDPTFYGPGFKHVLKESWDGHGIDWYAIGSYDLVTDKWVPDNPEIDVGIGLKYDYGKFYASKSFYDPIKRRRVLWGYVGETDPKEADLIKGWATILNFPRTIVLDRKTMSNILQWPIVEIENLRTDYHEFENVELGPGSIVPLHIPSATQLDIIATFEIDQGTLTTLAEVEGGYSCPTSTGSVRRGVLGPFGVVVLADESLTEQTPIYFYIARNANGTTTTHFCTDKLRSSKAEDAERVVYGSTVPVLDGENYSVRLLVDHSMVESFAQGGRTVVTSRVYPTKAIYEAAKIFVFNNATGISVKASVKIWQMGEAKFHGYPF